MALSSAQKLQYLRLPVVDASVTTNDKYALLGVVLTTTSVGTLPVALRKQVLRLPIVDASVSTSDKHALLGIFESSDSGALYELFDTTYLFDPTWNAFESPQSNDGSLLAGIAGFTVSWSGTNVNPVIVIPNPGTAITNANATTNVPTHINACDITGFKQYPNTMVSTWDGYRVRRKSYDPQHPQLKIKPTQDHVGKGSKRPEQQDRFIDTAVSVDDL